MKIYQKILIRIAILLVFASFASYILNSNNTLIFFLLGILTIFCYPFMLYYIEFVETDGDIDLFSTLSDSKKSSSTFVLFSNIVLVLSCLFLWWLIWIIFFVLDITFILVNAQEEEELITLQNNFEEKIAKLFNYVRGIAEVIFKRQKKDEKECPTQFEVDD